MKAELKLLQAETISQSKKVTTLTEGIADTLTKQWEGMTGLLKTETTSIIEAARKEFKEVNDQLLQLHEWTKKKIKQETQNRINSKTIIKEAGEAILKTNTSWKRKLRDPEYDLGTTSTKRQSITNPDADTNPSRYLSMPVLHQRPTASSALYYVHLDLILTQQDLFILALFLWVLFTNWYPASDPGPNSIATDRIPVCQVSDPVLELTRTF